MKRIVVLEGGGANIIREAVVAAELEQVLGFSFSQTADLIYGCSAGALFGALLVSGYSAAECLDQFRDLLPRVFRDGWRVSGFGAVGSKYQNDNLYNLMRHLVPITLGESPVKIAFPMREGLTRKNVYAKSWEPYWRDFRLADAAVGSSCAQTYFNGLDVCMNGRKSRFHDGGLIENNPVVSAYRDAIALWGRNQELVCVNPGCGRLPSTRSEPCPNGGILPWGPEFVEEVLDAQSEASEEFAPLVYDFYIRLSPERTYDIPLDCSDSRKIRLAEEDARLWCRANSDKIKAAAAIIVATS